MITVYLICFMLYAAGFVAARYVAGPELRRDLGWPLLVVLICLIGATFFRPSPLLLMLAYPIGLFVGVRNRLDALCRFVLMSMLTMPLSTPLTIGSAYLLRFSSQGALTLGLLAAVLAMPERRETELKPLPYGAVLAWLAFVIIAFGYDRIYTPTNIIRNVSTGLLDLVIPLYLIRACINRKDDVARLFACLIGGAVILVPYALFEARMGWAPFDAFANVMGGGSLGMAKSAIMRGGLLRASATFSTTLAFALFACLSLIAAVAFRDRLRSRSRWYLAMGACAIALLLAQSRGAWIMLAVSAAVFYGLRGRVGRLVGVATAAVLVFMLLLGLSSMSSQVAAFLGVSSSAGGPITDYRQTLLRRGIEEGKKAPILGQDMSLVQAKLSDMRQGEGIIDFVNTYLQFFLGAGLVGLVPFLFAEFAMLFSIAKQARRRTAGVSFQQPLYFIGAAFGGLMVFLFFDSFFDRVPLMFIMLLAAAKREVTAAERSRSTPLASSRPGRRGRRPDEAVSVKPAAA